LIATKSTREGGEVDGGKVAVYPIHSMFTTADMVKPASPITAVFSEKSIKSPVECHPGTVVFWPTQHLGDIASVEPIAIGVGRFGAKGSDFRDKGLNIFS